MVKHDVLQAVYKQEGMHPPLEWAHSTMSLLQRRHT